MPKSPANVESVKLSNLLNDCYKLDDLYKVSENDLQALMTLPRHSSVDMMTLTIMNIEDRKRTLTRKIRRAGQRVNGIKTEYVPEKREAEFVGLCSRVLAQEKSIRELVASMHDAIANYTEINTTTCTRSNALDVSLSELALVTNRYPISDTDRWLHHLQHIAAMNETDLSAGNPPRQVVEEATIYIQNAEQRYSKVQQQLNSYQVHGWGPSRDESVLSARQEIDRFTHLTSALQQAIDAADRLQVIQVPQYRQKSGDLPWTEDFALRSTQQENKNLGSGYARDGEPQGVAEGLLRSPSVAAQNDDTIDLQGNYDEGHNTDLYAIEEEYIAGLLTDGRASVEPLSEW